MAKKQRARVGKDKAADGTVQNLAEPFYLGVELGAGVCEGSFVWILQVESRVLIEAIMKGLRQEFSSHELRPSFEFVPVADYDVTGRAQIELDIDEHQPRYLAALQRQRMGHIQRDDSPDPVGTFLGWVVERAEKLASKIEPMLHSVDLERPEADRINLAVSDWGMDELPPDAAAEKLSGTGTEAAEPDVSNWAGKKRVAYEDCRALQPGTWVNEDWARDHRISSDVFRGWALKLKKGLEFRHEAGKQYEIKREALIEKIGDWKARG